MPWAGRHEVRPKLRNPPKGQARYCTGSSLVPQAPLASGINSSPQLLPHSCGLPEVSTLTYGHSYGHRLVVHPQADEAAFLGFQIIVAARRPAWWLLLLSPGHKAAEHQHLWARPTYMQVFFSKYRYATINVFFPSL